ncbi:MAG: TRAP transporter large permease subunit [Deltaproteobacteria bacterium]|jgi:C4-dicarboxylate transporter, DctM subunit|nr:TRAP transporter large permease subunit [Deltaproteobacteria bacterium]MBT4643792.1 TRAP transporter large permease subunit [Deltaproteobacteria bacterium]MBT7151728.1 TRAP transporter large permease subunit [Deltaproteobacteria bacterium]MBT7713434.1 TRAP transporter large permease subunit [Deltaproteobacteria bacterium]MBT7888810.1 TRAP transporter large permease subunit [Deltaproteobacteria bacterium]
MSLLLLSAIIVLLLVLRQNLVAILMVVAAYIHLVYGDGVLEYIIEDMYIAADKEVFLALPLFILCGSVMTRGAIAERLIEVIKSLTSPLPGGLAVTTILSCAVFAAISGSSPVTLLAIGTIMYPALLKEGYSKKFALGAVTSGGTLGIVIPPSIPMILYGIVTETSVVELFIAGVIPGILLTIVLSGYSLFANRRLPSKPWDLVRIKSAFRSGIWSMLMPIILLGGIYSGFFTPTEAAAVALFYSIVIELFVHKEVTLKDLYDTAVSTTQMFGTLFPLVAIAMSLNILLATQQVPDMVANWMTSVVDNRIMFILGLNILLLIVGCFMDIISAILILAPVLLPAAVAYGIEPVHLGVIMVLNLEIGFLTPPVGFNIIVAMTAFKEKFWLIARGVLPFIALMLAVLVFVSLVPSVSMFLVR